MSELEQIVASGALPPGAKHFSGPLDVAELADRLEIARENRKTWMRRYASYYNLPIPDDADWEHLFDIQKWFDYLESFVDDEGRSIIQVVRDP